MATHWPLTVAILQNNPTAGACQANAYSLAKRCHAAKESGADLILTPLMAICGAPIDGLSCFSGFHEQAHQALTEFANQVPADIPIILGHACLIGGTFVECIYLVHQTEIVPVVYRIPSPLPAASVKAANVTVNNTRISAFFADMLPTNPEEITADLLLVCDASTYEPKVQQNRIAKMGALAKLADRPVVYANLASGQDEWIFDGRSFILSESGEVQSQLSRFAEDTGYLSFVNRRVVSVSPSMPLPTPPSDHWPVNECYEAIVFSVREFLRKNNFSRILLGLSGGLDSALTLAIAVDAIGANRVTAVMKPSPYTADISLEDAQQMAKTLNVEYWSFPISSTCNSFLETLSPVLLTKTGTQGFTEENIQARVRGTMLMTLSNHLGALVLVTSNKSEVAVGYSTLYGDSVGGFAPLKDIYKTQAYQLAKYRNRLSPVIPERILQRPPSAELRPDQTDQDNLPAYDILDAILDLYLEKHQSIDDIVSLGFDRVTVEKVSQLVFRAEFKRRQSAPGPRLSKSYFSNNLPVGHHFIDKKDS